MAFPFVPLELNVAYTIPSTLSTVTGFIEVAPEETNREVIADGVLPSSVTKSMLPVLSVK